MSILGNCLSIAYYLGFIHAFLEIEQLLGMRRILVVTFHRVVEDGAASQLITGVSQGTSSAEFEVRIRLLTRWFTPISVAELDQTMANARSPARDSCLVTFDDAYSETLSIAAPILAKYKAAACVFVATAYVANQNRFWFVRVPDVLQQATVEQWHRISQDPHLPTQFAKALEHTSIESLQARRETWRRIAPVLDSATENERTNAIEIMESIVTPPQTPYLSILDWEQLRQMQETGIEIGGHSHFHPKLTTVETPRLESELSECWTLLREQLNTAPTGFAYPSGDYDDRVRSCLESSAFRLAFTTRFGLIHSSKTDRYELPRVYLPDGPPKNILITIAVLKLSKYMPRTFLKRLGKYLGQRLV